MVSLMKSEEVDRVISQWKRDSSPSSTLIRPPEPEVVGSIVDRINRARNSLDGATANSPSTRFKISNVDAARICQTLMAIKFVLEHTLFLTDSIKKHKEINDIYMNRIEELLTYITEQESAIDHRLSKSRIHPDKLARLEFVNNQLLFNEAVKSRKVEVLIQMIESLSLVIIAQTNDDNFPDGYKDRPEMAISKITKEAAEFSSANDKPKAPESLNMVSRDKLLKRARANENAQELFLALIEHVSEVSGPQKLYSMVTEICASAKSSSQATDSQLGVEDGETEPSTATAKQDHLPRDSVPSLQKYLKDSSFDYVLNDSGLSEKLALQLQVPSYSSSEQDIERGANGRIPWRCCPALEIELLKSENYQTTKLVQNILHALEKEGQGTALAGTSSKTDRKIQSDRIISLISYVEKLQRDIYNFYTEVYLLMPLPNSYRLSSSLQGWEMLSIVYKGIQRLMDDNRALGKRLGRFEPVLSQLFPEARDIAGEIQELIRKQAETVKENRSLRKSIMIKDKKLADEEAEGLRARDFRSARDEKLSKENLKMESELLTTKQELEKARKLPDIVRAEFYDKIQKLHTKNSDWEKKWEAEKAAHDILLLDNEATVKDLDKYKSKNEKYREAIDRHTEEYRKLKDERDRLRLSQAAGVEVQDLRNAAREANSREQKWADEKNDMEREFKKLQSERQIDLKTIQELSQRKQELKEQVSSIPALEKALATSEEVLHSTMNELEKERTKVKALASDEVAMAFKNQLEGKDAELQKLRLERALEQAELMAYKDRVREAMAAAAAAAAL